MNRRYVQNTAFQFMFISFFVYILLNIAATLVYFYMGYEAYGPQGNNDSYYYHKQATLIAQSGDFSNTVLPYEYLVGLIYYIFGVDVGPYAFKVFISLVGGFNIYSIVSILGTLCIHHNIEKRHFNKWSKIIGILILLYPTYIFYSLNMCRDLIIVGGVLVFIHCFLKIFIFKKTEIKTYCWFLAAILFVFILRPYFGVIITVTVFLFIFLQKKYLTMKNILILAVFIGVTGFLLKFTEFGLFGMNYLSIANLASVENYREASSAGNLVLSIAINFNNPIYLVLSITQAFIINHIYPLPNYIRGFSNILFIPENFAILYMLISIFRKVGRKVKQYKEMKFFLLFYFLNVGFIAIFSDNMGTNIRLRMAFVLCLMIMYFVSCQFQKEGQVKNSSDNIRKGDVLDYSNKE